MTHPSQLPRCTLPTTPGGSDPCGRQLLGNPKAPFCPVHDRVTCRAPVRGSACGFRLMTGTEDKCPQCGASVRLQDVLKGGTT